MRQFEREHIHSHRYSLKHENVDSYVSRYGSECWIDCPELTSCIFAEGILRPMEEEKSAVVAHKKAYIDIRGHVAYTLNTLWFLLCSSKLLRKEIIKDIATFLCCKSPQNGTQCLNSCPPFPVISPIRYILNMIGQFIQYFIRIP